MLRKKFLSSILLASCVQLIIFIPNSYALKTDRDQPADIAADEVLIDTKTGKRTFIGDVRFVQGTLKVKGDRVDAIYKNGKLVEAIAYGKPAAFQQRPDGKPNDVEGRGFTIVLNQADNLLTLKKKASLKQGPDVAKGTVIIYNMADDTLKVKGGTSQAQGSTGKRDKKAPPKTQTDPFFNEKPKPLKGSTPKTSDASSDATTEEASTDTTTEASVPEVSTQRRSDDLPEKLVLPGQSSSGNSSDDSSGRSRLIFKPKSN